MVIYSGMCLLWSFIGVTDATVGFDPGEEMVCPGLKGSFGSQCDQIPQASTLWKAILCLGTGQYYDSATCFLSWEQQQHSIDIEGRMAGGIYRSKLEGCKPQKRMPLNKKLLQAGESFIVQNLFYHVYLYAIN